MNCRKLAFLLSALLLPCLAGAARAQTPLAFVTNNPSDYWTICRRGTEDAAKNLGDVNVQFLMPADGTVATQEQGVNDLLAKGVQGIAISPVDPANQTAYLNAVAAKTILITSDSDAPRSKRLCYVGTDNRAAGRQAGQLLRQALPQGGDIMLFVGLRNARNAQEREQGIREALRGTRIHIVAVRIDDADHMRARQNPADALKRRPHLAGMVGLWSYNGPAILSAVKSAGKVGKVKIVAFDEEAETMNGVKSGAIYGTIVQQPYQFGYQSVLLLARLARGDKSAVPATRRIIVPTLAIKRGNVESYQKTQAKLLRGE